MAVVAGGIAIALARDASHSGDRRPFHDALAPIRAWLAGVRPDVAIVFYNDRGLHFLPDAMPTFAIGAAPAYEAASDDCERAATAPFAGDPDVSRQLMECLVRDEFDPCACQTMLVDRAFAIPTQLLWPERPAGLRFVPVHVNTMQSPQPSPARCFDLGRAVGRAVAELPTELRVVVVGSGTRTASIDRRFFDYVIDTIVERPYELAALSTTELIARAGSHDAELLLWLAMRGALGPRARTTRRASGGLLLEPVHGLRLV